MPRPLQSQRTPDLHRTDRGQVTPLLALVLVIVLLVALLVARVAGVVTDRSHARAAADAAALAGVIDGRAGAERLAVANGGVLIQFTSAGSTVEVTVRVGRAEASARATAEAVSAGGGAEHPGRVP